MTPSQNLLARIFRFFMFAVSRRGGAVGKTAPSTRLGWLTARLALAALVVVVGTTARVDVASAGGAAPLFDQTTNASTTTVTSQQFEPGFAVFDDTAADDFVVPTNFSWTLTSVVALGDYFNTNDATVVPTVNVSFFADLAGKPAAAATCQYNDLTATDTTVATGNQFTLNLPIACALTPGTWWIMVQAHLNLSPGGQWGWNTTTDSAPAGAAAQWQNPGDGFGTGCTTWGDVRTCLGTFSPNLAFKLFGTQASLVNPTTTTVSGAPNPSVFGQNVTITAHVASAGGTPPGTVDFTDGVAPLALAVPVNGSGDATFTTSALDVRDHTIVAAYNSSSALFLPSQGQYTQSVVRSDTTTAIASNVNPAVAGQPATLTATVSVTSPGVGTPTGTVTFSDGVTSIGTGAVDGTGHAALSLPAGFTAGGHSLTAQYGGDGSFNGSSSSALLETVIKAGTATTVVSSANPAGVGQPITFTAAVTVNAPGAGHPTGTVTFLDGLVTLGSGTVDFTGHASFTAPSLAVGAHAITASYSGDSNFEVSSSAPLAEVVVPTAAIVALASSANPSLRGDTVTFTATVSASSGSGTPTGSVAFFDGVTSLGNVALSGGVATLPVPFTTTGDHTINATYSGDGTFAGGETASLLQVVSAATTTTTLASSANPSTVGQPVTFTATVTSAAPGTITGSVTFFDGVATLGSSTVGGGTAAFTTSGLAVGTHPIKATYGGDADFGTSSSAILNQVVGSLPDAGPGDSGPPDSGPILTPDGGRDASGGGDGGGNDAGGGGNDSGSGIDGSAVADGGFHTDSGLVFPGIDAGGLGGEATEGGGCGCTTVGGSSSGIASVGALVGLALVSASRRRRRSKASVRRS